MHLLEFSHIPRQYWVPLATIQLDRVASIWWRDLGADSHTTTWSSFTNALGGEFGVPPAPLIPVMNLEIDSEEDPKEDPEEEVEDHIMVGWEELT